MQLYIGGIADNGTWAGFVVMCPPNDGYQPLVWGPSTGISLLPLPPGATSAKALGLNSDGTVVGWAKVGGFSFCGCIWLGGQIVLVPPVDSGDASECTAVNHQDQVVGYRWVDSSSFHPFVWDAGAITDIDPAPFPYGLAYDISDSGVVVGALGNQSTSGRAFRWAAGRLVILEPSLGGLAGC